MSETPYRVGINFDAEANAWSVALRFRRVPATFEMGPKHARALAAALLAAADRAEREKPLRRQ